MMEEEKKDYFQITVNKATVERIKSVNENVKNFISETKEKHHYVTSAAGNYENGLPIVDASICAADGETVVRQYEIAKMRTPLWKKAQGRLQITSQRVVFRAVGKNIFGLPIVREHEFAIDKVCGIEIANDYRFNHMIQVLVVLFEWIFAVTYAGLFGWALYDNGMTAATILTVLMSLAAIVVSWIVPRKYAIKAALCFGAAESLVTIAVGRELYGLIVLAALFGIAALLFTRIAALVEDLKINIKVKEGNGALSISCGFKKEGIGFSVVAPWNDTNKAIKEVGAMIHDINCYGEAGVNKWIQQTR